MLSLGKSFDREYKIQVPFLDGFYNVGVFFNKKSSFVLLSVDSDFRNSTSYNQTSAKVNMFKNLESSKVRMIVSVRVSRLSKKRSPSRVSAIVRSSVHLSIELRSSKRQKLWNR